MKDRILKIFESYTAMSGTGSGEHGVKECDYHEVADEIISLFATEITAPATEPEGGEA